MRTRDLGITIGFGRPGPLNAITDVAGVRVGHATIIEGDGPLVVGQGPVRTGVTVVVPRGPDDWREPVFAGLPPPQRQRRADRPRVGPRIRKADHADRHHQHPQRGRRPRCPGRRSVQHADPHSPGSLPVVGETYDGLLNDINGFHVRAEHLRAPSIPRPAARSRKATSVAGRGWSATSSRAASGRRRGSSPAERGGHTVGVLVQANYGKRAWLRVDGVPVGAEIAVDEVPSP